MEGSLSSLVTIVLTLCCCSIAQECEFAFTTQPPLALTCNPYGTSLQLECALASPPGTAAGISWFTGSTGTQCVGVKIALGGGSATGLGSSVISTGVIRAEEQVGTCYWCEVEVEGVTPSVTIQSCALCLLPQEAYAGLSNCTEDPANLTGTRTCVSLPSLTDLQIASPFLPQSPHTTLLPHISHHVGATPGPSQPTIHSPSFTLPSSTTTTIKGEEQGLYVAVAFCIIFLLVILLLVAIISLLCCRRYWKRTVAYSPRARAEGDTSATTVSIEMLGSDDEQIQTAFTGSADTEHASEPVILASLQLDTGSTPPSSARLARLSDPLDHDYSDLEDHSISGKSMFSRFSADYHGGRRLPRELETSVHSSQSLAHSHSSHLHTISVDEADFYDHLDPLYDDPAPDNSTLSPDSDKERFYHTLERSTHRRRREKGADSDHDKVHKLGLLQELFDDPKYAKLFLSIRQAQKVGEEHKFKRLSLGADTAVAVLNETAEKRKEGSTFDNRCSGDKLNHLVACSMPELPINAVSPQPRRP